MEPKNGTCTLFKFIALSIFLVLTVSATAYGRDGGTKSAQSTAAVKTDQNEWKKVIEAAKKEGKIVMSGPPGEEWRKSLVDMFQQEYPEITVEFTAGPGRNFWPRIRQERQLGKKLWDLRAGGLDPMTFDAKTDGFLAPIRPLLLPEIADGSKWTGGLDGLFIFSDKEKKYIFAFNLYLLSVAYVNHDFIKESDFKSISQILDPKLRGKIVILTPTGGASLKSLGYMAFMYGENFIRELLSKQDVIVTDDNRQQAEWVVRGKYPIAVGFVPPLLVPFQKQGLGRNVTAMALEEKIIPTTTGSGSISLLEGAPHPNATRLYINWLLSQKTQAMLTKNVELNSSRTDVPPVKMAMALDLAHLSKYRSGDTEENSEFIDRILPVINNALKK